MRFNNLYLVLKCIKHKLAVGWVDYLNALLSITNIMIVHHLPVSHNHYVAPPPVSPCTTCITIFLYLIIIMMLLLHLYHMVPILVLHELFHSALQFLKHVFKLEPKKMPYPIIKGAIFNQPSIHQL